MLRCLLKLACRRALSERSVLSPGPWARTTPAAGISPSAWSLASSASTSYSALNKDGYTGVPRRSGDRCAVAPREAALSCGHGGSYVPLLREHEPDGSLRGPAQRGWCFPGELLPSIRAIPRQRWVAAHSLCWLLLDRKCFRYT